MNQGRKKQGRRNKETQSTPLISLKPWTSKTLKSITLSPISSKDCQILLVSPSNCLWSLFPPCSGFHQLDSCSRLFICSISPLEFNFHTTIRKIFLKDGFILKSLMVVLFLYRIVVKEWSPESNKTELKSALPVVWLWTTFLSFLYLSYSICKIGINSIFFISLFERFNKMTCKVLFTKLGSGQTFNECYCYCYYYYYCYYWNSNFKVFWQPRTATPSLGKHLLSNFRYVFLVVEADKTPLLWLHGWALIQFLLNIVSHLLAYNIWSRIGRWPKPSPSDYFSGTYLLG